MKKLKFLPNLLTLSNLFCGVLAVIYALDGSYLGVIYLLIAASLFDFFDGFAARLTKSESIIGKDLDSLADMVSFGLAPSLGLYHLLSDGNALPDALIAEGNFAPFAAFALPIASAYRLAVFNHDSEQKHYFKGLPTPANGLFWAFLVYCVSTGEWAIYQQLKPVFLVIIAMIFSLLMISGIPMLSLKKDKKKTGLPWPSIALLALFLLMFVIWQAKGIPLAFIGYLILSLVFNPPKKP
jgi:CDP-diacylglycerol--serine O-phosphatidyltransferase